MSLLPGPRYVPGPIFTLYCSEGFSTCRAANFPGLDTVFRDSPGCSFCLAPAPPPRPQSIPTLMHMCLFPLPSALRCTASRQSRPRWPRTSLLNSSCTHRLLEALGGRVELVRALVRRAAVLALPLVRAEHIDRGGNASHERRAVAHPGGGGGCKSHCYYSRRERATGGDRHAAALKGHRHHGNPLHFALTFGSLYWPALELLSPRSSTFCGVPVEVAARPAEAAAAADPRAGVSK